MVFLENVAYAVAFVAGAIALTLGSYWVTRRLSGASDHDRHKDMAGAMILRIGALHGLILALVFAQEMTAYQRLETQTATEANAIADVFNDATRYDPVVLRSLQQALVDYVQTVIETEWDSLGNGGDLSAEAWSDWDGAYQILLDLTPTTPRQQALRDHMLLRIHDISISRNMRESDGANSIMWVFWFAALSGVVLIAAGYYTYPPERHNLLLMAMFAAYTGIILFLIYGFSDPFGGPAALQPESLQRLYAQIAPGFA